MNLFWGQKVCLSLTHAYPIVLLTASVVSCGGRQSASCFKSKHPHYDHEQRQNCSWRTQLWANQKADASWGREGSAQHSSACHCLNPGTSCEVAWSGGYTLCVRVSATVSEWAFSVDGCHHQLSLEASLVLQQHAEQTGAIKNTTTRKELRLYPQSFGALLEAAQLLSVQN